MAYPVETIVTEAESSSSATKIEVQLPPHQEDDVVFVSVAIDANISPTVTMPGTPWVELVNSTGSGVRQILMYAVAGATPLSNPIITWSAADGANAIATVVRDADVSGSPIDNWASNTASVLPACPALSTTTPDTLLLGFMVLDQAVDPRFGVSDANILGQSHFGAATNWQAYKVFHGTGAAPVFGSYAASISDGGLFALVAVKNKAGGALPPVLQGGPVQPFQLGELGTPAFSSLAVLIPTIGGETVYSYGAGSNVAPLLVNEWGRLWRFIATPAANSPGFYASYATITETDFTVGPMSVRWEYDDSISYTQAENPYYIILIDTSGNYSGFGLQEQRSRILSRLQQTETVVLDIPNLTPFVTSTTPADLAHIDRVAFGYRRNNTSATLARTLRLKNLYLWPKSNPLTLVGGSAASRASALALANLMNAAGFGDLASRQGGGQVVMKFPFQLGDGTTATHIYSEPGAAIEFARPSPEFRVADDELAFTIKSSASDDVEVGAGVVGSVQRHRMQLHASSSPSASYDFGGLVITGVEFYNDTTGVVVNGVTFAFVRAISLLGGGLANCVIKESVSNPAVTTSDPSKIAGCTFISGGSGHAIEITTPGTYTFTGNTFSGYGADGTLDAAIYNNSGGAVTLNITGGGDTPTVYNGSGATTNIVSGATLTLTGLQPGSDIVILEAGTTTERVNVDAHAGTSYGYAYTVNGSVDIALFKVGFVPTFVRGFTLDGVNASIPIVQRPDPAYSNPA